MGAPKQRWTAEEESALKAGVRKHGPGKWRTILKDPEFSGVLCLRSNVDLKDKWRNMSVTANGWGSRDRGRLALKRNKTILKKDDNTLSIGAIEEFQDDVVDATPLAIFPRTLEISIPEKPFPRTQIRIASRVRVLTESLNGAEKMLLEDLILEAITCLKESSGSNLMDITMYIEDLDNPPLNFKCMLSTKLEALVAAGKIVKVKSKYRIAPSLCTRVTGLLPREGTQQETSKVENDVKKSTKIEKDDVKPLTKSQIDAELLKVMNMNPQEAAEAAARAVAEAEIAIAEAEEAAREAEAAEADAEAAQLFAEAAMTALRNRSIGKLMVST